MGNTAELLTRLAIGAILGSVIGYERHVHRRPAGLRTHLLVGLASTTFMIVSTHFVYFQHYAKEDLVAVDPSRIAASVVTGVGFLGGGAILRTGLNVQGLTTAAGLWLVAAIGLSAGAGMYLVSGVVTAIGVVALTVMRKLERKEDDVGRYRVTLTLDRTAPPRAALREALVATGARVGATEYERRLDDGHVRIAFQARLPRSRSDELLDALEGQPGVRRIQVELVSP